MRSQRIERVQKLLRAEISEILLRRTKDPRVSMVTITEVDVSPELKNARVYFTVMHDPSASPEESPEAGAQAGLRSAAGFIRFELMQVLHLRPMPVLEFVVDEALARGSRTLDILDRIGHEHEEHGPDAASGG